MAKQPQEPRSTYHFLESYLSRQQIERVLNHYRDYISAALYILHDKDTHQVETDGGVRRTELQDEYNKIVREINLLDISINNAFDIIGKREFETAEEKALFRKTEITEKKRKKTLLQKKAMRISDDIRNLDKELEIQGTLKKPHYHILLKCYGAHTENAVRKWFYRFHVTEEVKNEETGETELKVVNTLNKICDSVAASRDYLTHKNESEHLNKYVYDTKDVLTFGSGWSAFNKAGRASDDVLDILDRLTEGESLRNLVRDYGRDVVINYNKYMQFATRMQAQEDHARDIADRENDIIRHFQKVGTDDWYPILNQLNEAMYIVAQAQQIINEVNKKR